MTEGRRDLLGRFAHHRVAANLLMFVMLLTGAWALEQMNVQFFPNFELDFVTVRVVWTGASAEDIEDGITIALEQRLKNVDNLHRLTSTSSLGVSAITLEFKDGTDPIMAVEQVRRLVDEFRNLPQEAERPVVNQVVRYEPVARLLVTGAGAEELREQVRRFETELLARGIDKVDIRGLTEQEIAIEIDSATLGDLRLSLDEVGERVAALSRDLPAGILGEADGSRELRSLDQRRNPTGYAALSALSDDFSRIDLGAVAQIQRQDRDGQVTLSVAGKPAVVLSLQRAENGDSLKSARILNEWLAETRPRLPPSISLTVYDESWQLIWDRIMLLLKNGSGGLALVIATLYLFLSGRVALWVAVGIPVSFMATLFVLYLAGGSVNMISLFALIMALGIIVDDAIVVGEDALAHYQMGEPPLLAAEGGARRMLAPVIASSLTTIAAFLPLMLIGGIIGKLLFTIPLVIVSVIIASLIESFLVLPGHLRGAFVHMHVASRRSLRARLDARFEHFRERVFRPLVTRAVRYRATTISAALALLIVGVGLLAGGRLNFTFFPTPEAQIIHANATFVAGTSRETVNAFLDHLESTLRETESDFGKGRLINVAIAHLGETLVRTGQGPTADQLGAMEIELIAPDERTVRNEAFIKAWRERITLPPGMESFVVTSRRAGPPGRDLTVRLTGEDAADLKAAALELGVALEGINGVSEIEEDMPFGREQLIYSLSPQGEALGLTVAELGRQLRTAFDGRLVQIFQDGPDEIEVRVKLPRTEREHLSSLQQINIRTPNGDFVPLPTVSRWHAERGFEALRHADGQLAVQLTGDVDRNVTNVNNLIATLEESVLPDLARRYHVAWTFEGRSADQRETLADMKKGMMLGLMLIYLVLAAVFASYSRPLVVMSAIPFGLVGALFGHWIMGLDLTILSLFGLFGLSGIVVNDSIILVTFYNRLREQGMEIDAALSEAACQRLRAVLLTSLTTIAGLSPLLFETSLQAQFLIPMATSIAFGLAGSTFLVLLVVPALLAVSERARGRLSTGLNALTAHPAASESGAGTGEN